MLPLEPEWVVYYESRNDVGSQLLPPTGVFMSEEAAPWLTARYLSLRFPERNLYMRTLVVYLAHTAVREHFGGRGWYPLRDPPTATSSHRILLGNAGNYVRNLRTLVDACKPACGRTRRDLSSRPYSDVTPKPGPRITRSACALRDRRVRA